MLLDLLLDDDDVDNNEGDEVDDDDVVSLNDNDLVGSGTGARLGLDGNEDAAAAVVVVLLAVGALLDVPTNVVEPGAVVVVSAGRDGATNLKPSINAGITDTALDLNNFEWN